MKQDFNTLHLLWAIRDIPKSDINGMEKSLLTILLSCSGASNVSWHSLTRIAKMSGFARSTVAKYLATLEQKQFIKVKHAIRPAQGNSNQYSLNNEKIMHYSSLATVPPRGLVVGGTVPPRGMEPYRHADCKKEKKKGVVATCAAPPPPIHPLAGLSADELIELQFGKQK